MKLIYLITAILVIAKALVLDMYEIPQSLYFGWFAFVAALLMFKKPTISRWTLVLIAVSALSLLLNSEIITSAMRPWDRLGAFVVIMASVGPLFRGEAVERDKERIFNWLSYSLIVVVVISFILISFKAPIAFDRSGVRGLFFHSMVLSPMAAVAALLSLYKFISLQRFVRWLYLCIFVMCVATTFLAASRGAIGALLIAILFCLYFSYYKRVGRLLGGMMVVLFLLAISTSVWTGYIENLMTKQEQRISGDDMLSGRSLMWMDRIAEFERSPVLGVGFGNVYETSNSKVDMDIGQAESGSGWLTVLSNIGIVGFFAVAMLFFGRLRHIFYFAKQQNFLFILYASLILFFSIHSLIEGYIFGVGGIIFFFMWISVSMINQSKYYVINN